MILGVICTLSGKDQETKASFAFGVIIAKLETSHSKIYWNYMVKNLIILDRAVEERLFLNDIAKLKIQEVENFQPLEEKYGLEILGEIY